MSHLIGEFGGVGGIKGSCAAKERKHEARQSLSSGRDRGPGDRWEAGTGAGLRGGAGAGRPLGPGNCWP
jgi:hypothetical protein